VHDNLPTYRQVPRSCKAGKRTNLVSLHLPDPIATRHKAHLGATDEPVIACGFGDASRHALEAVRRAGFAGGAAATLKHAPAAVVLLRGGTEVAGVRPCVRG
jgi:hypothetical protein